MSDQAMHHDGRDRPAQQKVDQQIAAPPGEQAPQSRPGSTEPPERRGIPGPGRRPLFRS